MTYYRRHIADHSDMQLILDKDKYYVGLIYDMFFKPYPDSNLKEKNSFYLKTTTKLWEF